MPASCLLLIARLAYLPTLKMKAIRSPNTSVDFHRTTGRYTPFIRLLVVYDKDLLGK
jgi:hypothetical protein